MRPSAQPLDIGGYAATIVGVYDDFNWSSAHEARKNVFFGYTGGGRYASMRVRMAELPTTLASIESLFERLFPGNVFQYAFADEAFDAQYREDERFASLFTLFAGLAIAIACLGLFGLADFHGAAAQEGNRRAEGARCLGARAWRCCVARDFLKLVAVAVLVGIPVAYVANAALAGGLRLSD